ncbi:unnamed protein product [Protopolystoma xenopodis]|uniref:Uncharacterized protein n=1 Tax=Protopolystoma xenopodis TaxID=117903 RepID=A0A3S5AGW8_9PLAT|nr:unnamed protein product [Protopolystoma xenopodis]
MHTHFHLSPSTILLLAASSLGINSRRLLFHSTPLFSASCARAQFASEDMPSSQRMCGRLHSLDVSMPLRQPRIGRLSVPPYSINFSCSENGTVRIFCLSSLAKVGPHPDTSLWCQKMSSLSRLVQQKKPPNLGLSKMRQYAGN